jgi:aryl-alcohol dehydrogenase-like predicted oxidoreductase
MMLERGAHYAMLDELKQEGKIRYYGVSVHDAYEGTMAIATGKPDVIQVAYNFLRQDPREDLFPLAQEHDIGLVIREPLANGMLTGKYPATTTFAEGDMRTEWPQEFLALQARLADKARFLATPERTLAQAALRFVLDASEVSVVIPGVKTVEQVLENLAASDLAALTADEHASIQALLEDMLDEEDVL